MGLVSCFSLWAVCWLFALPGGLVFIVLVGVRCLVVCFAFAFRCFVVGSFFLGDLRVVFLWLCWYLLLRYLVIRLFVLDHGFGVWFIAGGCFNL